MDGGGIFPRLHKVISPALHDLLGRAARLVAFTGAGISQESGLPTFREAQTGLWARFSPEELATPEAFARQPGVVWNWYEWRRRLVLQAEPNAAHLALARLDGALADFTLVTQNVDGLHRRAGNQGVLELHGDILRTVCSRERTPVDLPTPTDDLPVTPTPDGRPPPPCPRCGAPVRPDVVWFGEMLPAATLDAAWAAAARCDLMLVIGTSGRVHPAAGLVPVALEAGATVVVVDPGSVEWAHPSVHHLRGTAGAVVPRVVDVVLAGSTV